MKHYNSSYGSVFKGIHKASGKVVAIKIVPFENQSEIDELMKEIAILKRCDNDYIVTYYGSYFKDTNLWVNFSWYIYIYIYDNMRL